jgi:hypothetical protein
MDKKKLTSILLVVGVYLLTSAASYTFFAAANSGSSITDIPDSKRPKNDFDQIVFDDGPKTEVCPLNGAKYSKAQKNWWEKHRPLGVMIENHEEARPQSGLSFADVVYEVVAEGGITRFLAVYYCQDGGIVGPVRSARTYFLDFISEYGPNPLYAHVGGANTPGPANALGQIEDYGWGGYNDLNQFSIGYPTFRRDESRLGREVATEHTMYSTTSKLWDIGKKRGLTQKDEDGVEWNEEFDEYEFKDDAPLSQRGSVKSMYMEFWEGYGTYSVEWTYNKESNSYLRENGGEAHKDRNTGKQISAKNVVVLYMTERAANDGYEGNAHRLYGTKGSGEAVVFQDGKEIEATWRKADRESRLIVTADGKEIKFNRGLIWFEVLPTGSPLEVN